MLVLAGTFIAATGLNVGGGGIATLGWQGPTDFLTVADAGAYANQDNHVRFLGGVWLGIGLTFITAGFALRPLRSAILILCALIFLGGLMRFSALDPGLIAQPGLAGSAAAEIIGMPVLAFWLWRSGRVQALTGGAGD